MRNVKFLGKGFLDSVAPPAEGEAFLWSAELAGWGLRISWTGRAAWVVQCRIRGQSRRTTIGDVRLKTPAEAHKRARAILASAEDGLDLIAAEKATEHAEKEREAFAQERTIGRLVEYYLTDAAVRRKRSFGGVEHYLRTVWAELHAESAELIDRDRLGRSLEGIASTRGAPTANRARSQLSALFSWGLSRGWPAPGDPSLRVRLARESNPCQYLHRWPEKSRDRVLDLAELGAVWRLAPQAGQPFGDIVRLLVLSGCRKTEIGELRWKEVDFDKTVINLPRHRTKNARPHTIPLAPRAVEILQAQPKTSSPLLFSSFAWSRAKSTLDDLLAAERERDGLPPMADWVIHDLRRSFVTGLAEHVCPDDPLLIELLVNHSGGVRGGVAGVYQRSQRLPARRKALETWCAMVQHAAGEAVASADVVPLRRG